MSITKEEIDRRFSAYPVNEEQAARMQEIRLQAGLLARRITGWTKESREQSVAITNLEDVVFWANAAIARNG